jgi:hypothetical protein
VPVEPIPNSLGLVWVFSCAVRLELYVKRLLHPYYNDFTK